MSFQNNNWRRRRKKITTHKRAQTTKRLIHSHDLPLFKSTFQCLSFQPPHSAGTFAFNEWDEKNKNKKKEKEGKKNGNEMENDGKRNVKHKSLKTAVKQG